MITQILLVCSAIFVMIFLRSIAIYSSKIINKVVLYQNQEYINDIFDRCKKMAYFKVLHEDVMVNTWNGTTVNKKDIDKISRKYIELVFLYAGNNIIDDLTKIHGDIENLIALLTSELITKIVDDELDMFSRKSEEFSSNGLDQYAVNKIGVDNG